MNWLTKIGTVIKKDIFVVGLMLVAMFALFALTNCNAPHRASLQIGSDPIIQAQSDPTNGLPVQMQSTDAPHAVAQEQALGYSISEVHAQVILATHKVHVSLKKVSGSDTVTIDLDGVLDDKLKGLIYDTQPVNNQYRMKGYVACRSFSDQPSCPELIVNVRFIQNGIKLDRQFQVQNEIVDSAPAANISPAIMTVVNPPPPTPTQSPPASSTGKQPSAPEVAPAAAPETASPAPTTPSLTPPTDTPAAVEPAGEEESILTGNGRIITAPPPADFDSDLIDPTADTTNPNTTKKHLIKPVVHEDDELQIPADALTLSDVQLSGGGRSVNYAFTVKFEEKNHPAKIMTGKIVDGRGTMLPQTGDNYDRLSPDNKAWGTGYSTSFFDRASSKFKELYPQCGRIKIENFSPPGGGILIFDHPINGKTQHASHQNGLDMDVAYLPLTSLHSVLNRNHTGVTSELDDDCTYKWIKLITNLYYTNESRHYVNMVLVHSVVQKHFCGVKKKHKYNSPEDEHMFSVIVPTKVEHDDHMHIRLNCSTEHEGCRDDYPTPQHCP